MKPNHPIHPQRTPLADISLNAGPDKKQTISVEKWWIPLDDVRESYSTIAFVSIVEGAEQVSYIMTRKSARKLANKILAVVGTQDEEDSEDKNNVK